MRRKNKCVKDDQIVEQKKSDCILSSNFKLKRREAEKQDLQ